MLAVKDELKGDILLLRTRNLRRPFALLYSFTHIMTSKGFLTNNRSVAKWFKTLTLLVRQTLYYFPLLIQPIIYLYSLPFSFYLLVLYVY